MHRNMLPYHLESLEVDGCFGIQHAEISGLSPQSQWIFITGNENSTNLLKGMAVAYYNQRLERTQLPFVMPAGKIKLGLMHEDRILPRLDYTYDGGRPYASSAYPRPDQAAFLLGYGSVRQPCPGQAAPTRAERGANTTVISLLSEEAPRLDLSAELLLSYRENVGRFGVLVSLMQHLWPALNYLRIERRNLYFVLHSEENLSWNQVPRGIASLLTMAVDLYLTLGRVQGRALAPDEIMGMVLIEEPELHLPPALRRQLPRLLSTAFPQVQFIAATYSPMLLMGAPENAVFLNLEPLPNGTQQLRLLDMATAQLDPAEILASPLFDYQDLPQKTQPGPAADFYGFDQAMEEELETNTEANPDDKVGRVFGSH